MRNFYIVDIEPLDNRYTKQWRDWIPKIAQEYLGDTYNVVNIEGVNDDYVAPEPGAFFDFIGTCKYKASQATKIADLFRANKVQNGDVFFFTDAWNQSIHFLKYISELHGIDVKTAGIWHAGAYDPTDILGVKISNKAWVHDFERSCYHALDLNFFGTLHHCNIFLKTLELEAVETDLNKCRQVGYPLEWLQDLRNNQVKENIVVFPHRLNYDKAPYVFDEIAIQVQKTRPDIQFIKTQTLNLEKSEYYNFLKRCKVIFSANRHENLGIGTFEAMSSGCLPLVPDKLSYREMYPDFWKYSVSDNLYETECDRSIFVNKIIDFIDNYDSYLVDWNKDITHIYRTYFTGEHMFTELKKL